MSKYSHEYLPDYPEEITVRRKNPALIISLAALIAVVIIAFATSAQHRSIRADVELYKEEIATLNKEMAAYEAAKKQNTDLASENERLAAMNEEINVVNDILEAANEELTASNRELYAANGELERQNGDLSKKYDGLSKPD